MPMFESIVSARVERGGSVASSYLAREISTRIRMKLDTRSEGKVCSSLSCCLERAPNRIEVRFKN